ncbi:MAG: glycoside hydrolase family 43 protein [Tepidisphaeraceae bacterium]
MNQEIQNPVLPGFHPDPSIVRVGDDYVLATSTFEWFPGIALFRSRDLANWKPIGHVLTRGSQLSLLGVGDSAGLWAPSISYDGVKFHLVVCQVRTRTGPFKDMSVMLFTADRIDGPWSDGVCIARSGFDPSLFHDPVTRQKWLVNIQWDFRQGMPRFAGIVLQEFDSSKRCCVGPMRTVLTKPHLLEGPNIYYRDGWYYLMCAEGGTGWNHGISMARARSVTGPYEVDPQPLVLTTRHSPGNPLQKSGHGELVQTRLGEWYLAHLASRPVYPDRRSLLGRETCIQKVTWSDDGWLRLARGGIEPDVRVPVPTGIEPYAWPADPIRDDFDAIALSPHWQTLRVPFDESWATLTERPGHLRLRGRESLHSLFEQSLLARRIESACCTITTKLQFQPTHFTQSAGLIVYYDTRQHYYLRITHDERADGRVLGIVQTDDGAYSELPETQIKLDGWPDAIHLRAHIDRERLQFSASADGAAWRAVGCPLDFTRLSDDYGSTLRFTGPMAGVCCQDLNVASAMADVDFFEMQNH